MRGALLIALATLVLAAGCGGGDDPAVEEPPAAEAAPQAGYVESLRLAFEPVLEAAGGLGDISGLDELEAGLEEVEGAALEGADRLRETDPPEEAAGAHDRLVTGLEILGEQAQNAQAALEAAQEGDLAELPALLEVGSGLGLEGLIQIRDALAELRERGFDVERIGGA